MNKGVWLTLLLCCGWPIICIAIYEWLKRVATQRDWTNIHWSDIRWPWSKHE